MPEPTGIRGSRLRLASGSAAALLAAGLAATLLPGAGRVVFALLPFGGIGLVAAILVVAGFERLTGAVLFSLAGEFVVRLLVRGVDAPVAIGYATGLLVLCELLGSTASTSRRARFEPAVVAARGCWLVGSIAVAVAAATLTLVGGSVRLGSALAAVAVGLLAAVGLLGAAYLLTSRHAVDRP